MTHERPEMYFYEMYCEGQNTAFLTSEVPIEDFDERAEKIIEAMEPRTIRNKANWFTNIVDAVRQGTGCKRLSWDNTFDVGEVRFRIRRDRGEL